MAGAAEPNREPVARQSAHDCSGFDWIGADEAQILAVFLGHV
jgi:hypothetical protein